MIFFVIFTGYILVHQTTCTIAHDHSVAHHLHVPCDRAMPFLSAILWRIMTAPDRATTDSQMTNDQCKFGFIICWYYNLCQSIKGVVYRSLEPKSGQPKDYNIGICCFSAKYAVRWKSKEWKTWNQDNVSEWGDMSTRGLLFQWAITIKIQLSVLV